MTKISCSEKLKSIGYFSNSRNEMLRYLPEGIERTLEIGCGEGLFSELIKQRFGAECWGVEIDEESSNIAAQKITKVLYGDVFEVLDYIPNNYFDCIIFNDVLEHLVDPYLLLDQLRVKLRGQGTILASIPNVRFWNNLRDLFWRGLWDYKDAGILDKTHLRFFTYKSLIKTFNQLNYEILQIEGLRPTHSTSFKILNFILFNRLWDAKFHQFACVITPR